MSKLIAFLKEENGASAAEYALILAIVGVGIVTATIGLRGAISGAISNAANCVNTASSGTC
jgi:pilus assembly protein Flp/PilA